MPAEEVLDGKLSLRTHILHKYLPPVECDLTVEFAGMCSGRCMCLNQAPAAVCL